VVEEPRADEVSNDDDDDRKGNPNASEDDTWGRGDIVRDEYAVDHKP
jgi:hypothetical protein